MFQKPNQRLVGQTAIVTGAGSGIGKGCALALAREGANVTINYVDKPAEAEETASQIQDQDGQTLLVQANISKENQVEHLFAETIKTVGAIDIFVWLVERGLVTDKQAILLPEQYVGNTQGYDNIERLSQ